MPEYNTIQYHITNVIENEEPGVKEKLQQSGKIEDQIRRAVCLAMSNEELKKKGEQDLRLSDMCYLSN